MPGPEDTPVMQMVTGKILRQDFSVKAVEWMYVMAPRVFTIKAFGHALIEQHLLFALKKAKTFVRFDDPYRR